MDINLDSTSWQWLPGSGCTYFWTCRWATESKDRTVLVWFTHRRYGKQGVLGFFVKRWFTNTVASANWPRLLVFSSSRTSLPNYCTTRAGSKSIPSKKIIEGEGTTTSTQNGGWEIFQPTLAVTCRLCGPR